MKKEKFVIYSLILFSIIACLFAPYLRIDGIGRSVIEIVQNYEINEVFATVFAAFGLYFIGVVLLFLPTEKKWVAPLSFLFTISANILFATTKSICEYALVYNSFKLTVAPIFLALTSFATSIYSSRLIFDNTKLNIRDIAEIAIFVSFAFVLDLPIFKFKVVANGGSISLIMLPLILLSLRKGFFRGFIGAGIVFGLVSCFLDGYGLITYPLDYLLGFGAMAVVGLFRKFIIGKEKLNYLNFIILFSATLLAMVLRTFASTLSGIFIYQLDFVSSLIYQLTYMGPSFVAVMVVLCILLYPLNRLSLKNK